VGGRNSLDLTLRAPEHGIALWASSGLGMPSDDDTLRLDGVIAQADSTSALHISMAWHIGELDRRGDVAIRDLEQITLEWAWGADAEAETSQLSLSDYRVLHADETTELHLCTVRLQDDLALEAGAIVDPVPLLVVAGAFVVAGGVAVAGYLGHRKDRDALRRQWETDSANCYKNGGRPKGRFSCEGEWDPNPLKGSLKMKTKSNYEFQCQ
jgi:hypothetical protein